MGASVTMLESPKGQRRRPLSALWVFWRGMTRLLFTSHKLVSLTRSLLSLLCVCGRPLPGAGKKNNILESQVSHQHCCGLTDTSEAKLKYGRSAKYFLNATKSFSLGV